MGFRHGDRSRSLACLLLLSAPPCLASASRAQIQFQEVTASVGISHSGTSWGASWGDLDADGDPDLWVGNHHLGPPHLYRNEAGVGFTDVAPQSVGADPGDSHGAQWADFDNDGDQDLLQQFGAGGDSTGNNPNELLVNVGGILTDEALFRGLGVPLGRGRTPLFWDRNGDGLLDVILSNLGRSDGSSPSGLYEQQTDGTFALVEVFPQDATIRSVEFAQLGDFSGDGAPEVAVSNPTPGPSLSPGYRILDTSTVPFTNASSAAGPPPLTGVRDAAIADFNGDLQLDLYLARSATAISDFRQPGPTELELAIGPQQGDGIDLATVTPGAITVSVPEDWFWQTSEIFIGGGGANPARLTFSLSEQDPGNHGLAPFTPGVDRGVFIGYDPSSQQWMLRVSVNAQLRGEFNAVITTTEPIATVQPLGFTAPGDSARPDALFFSGPGGFVDVTSQAGLVTSSCRSVAAGDLDNDGDVDLYLACSGQIDNEANIVLENDGSGAFTMVPGAGGAAGSSEGRSESATLADYDGDGFLDVFVTNGFYGPPFDDGPQQLFRNLGNANHWIEVDLQGVVSNRDGIGARVFGRAGGQWQLRSQDGGMHNRSQNHQRLHFGLGPNTQATLLVRWPSGLVQLLPDVAADQILTIVEAAPECAVATSRDTYTRGQRLVLTEVRFRNPSSGQVPAVLRIQLELPNGNRIALAEGGADGSLAMPAGFDIGLGPIQGFTVTSNFPVRGSYRALCQIEQFATGRILAEAARAFTVR